MRKSQAGSAFIGLVLAVLLVAVVGYAAYMVFYQEDVADNNAVVPAEEQAAPIESSEDIDQQLEEIESTNLDEQFDTNELEDDAEAL